MKIESRYVEYSGGKMVVSSPWKRHVVGVPKGCMDVGISRKEALRRVRAWRKAEKEGGCYNFEYRVI